MATVQPCHPHSPSQNGAMIRLFQIYFKKRKSFEELEVAMNSTTSMMHSKFSFTKLLKTWVQEHKIQREKHFHSVRRNASSASTDEEGWLTNSAGSNPHTKFTPLIVGEWFPPPAEWPLTLLPPSSTRALQLVSWNVVGICDPRRKLLVKILLSLISHLVHVIMLQELKADDFQLITALDSIATGYHHIIAFPQEGQGGTTLLIHLDFTITNNGAFPHSTTAWASILGPLGTLKMA